MGAVRDRRWWDRCWERTVGGWQSRSWADRPGDPTATRSAILKVVDADQPPLRIFFGKTPIEVATQDYESRLATWNQWQPVSVAAYGA
jgi:hypothetical protein